jgi:hypothetical protein
MFKHFRTKKTVGLNFLDTQGLSKKSSKKTDAQLFDDMLKKIKEKVTRINFICLVIKYEKDPSETTIQTINFIHKKLRITKHLIIIITHSEDLSELHKKSYVTKLRACFLDEKMKKHIVAKRIFYTGCRSESDVDSSKTLRQYLRIDKMRDLLLREFLYNDVELKFDRLTNYFIDTPVESDYLMDD